MKNKMFQRAGLALLLTMIAGVSNASIVHTYYDIDGSAVVTYTDLGSNQLQIEFDNTSAATMSSLINGLVFDVDADINTMTVLSFEDGNGTNLVTATDPLFSVALNINNEITPGKTVVDVAIESTQGIHGGIYNSAENSGVLANANPDIAKLILLISDPDPWALNEISNDFLRMQRTGTDGEGSLKLPPTVVPVPAAAWLFGTGLLGLVGVARRRTA